MEKLRELLGLGTDEPTTPDLTDYSDADLNGLRDEIRAALGDRDELSVSEVKAIVSFGKTLKAELDTRQELAADIDDLTAPDPEPEEAPKAEEPKKDAKVADVKRPAAAAPTTEPVAEVEEEEEAEPEMVAVAASGAPGALVPADAPVIETAEQLGHAMQAAWNGTSASNGAVHNRVLHKRWNTPHSVDTDAKGGQNYRAIQASFMEAQERAKAQVYGGQTIQAASGICGPLEPRYSFLQLASGTAGIIDLPALNAQRGGVRFPQAVTAYDLRAQDGIADPYTSADGSAGTAKLTYTVACPDISNFELTAYQTNLRFSNFQGQFFPEYVSHVSDVSLAQHAHVVNGALIDAIQASADAVTYDSNGATKLGDAWVQFTRQVTFHTWLYRDKYATAQDLVLDVIAPYRALGALVAAVMARDSSRPEAAAFAVRSAVDAFGREIGARIQFVYDFQPMVEAAHDFGSEAYEFIVFPAGEVVNITGATLDLGVVRDSTRNAQNEFDTWVETFDGIATAGYEIMRVQDVRLCPNGEVGERVTIACATTS